MSETEIEASAGSKNQKPKALAARTLIVAFSVVVISIAAVWCLNHFIVDRPLQQLLLNDARNHSIKASSHWKNWVNPDELVFNVKGLTGEDSRLDVFRVFLQYAGTLKDKRYSRVVLASQGRPKFTIDGTYFQELGAEYDTQHPLYTIRTFPTHVSTMDGGHPFHEYEGGILGVLDAEMEQFSEFSDEWYLNDFQNSIAAASEGKNTNAANFDPCEGLREQNPHCDWKAHWEDSGVSVNAIDGTKSEFLSMESLDADGIDSGDLHYAAIKLCFDNGNLCHGNIIGAGIRVHGMLASLGYESEYSTPVRLKFDDGTPKRETWGMSEDHETLFPSGHEKNFATELTQHKKLFVEFSYYEQAPRTISFDLTGLDDAMKSKGLAF